MHASRSGVLTWCAHGCHVLNSQERRSGQNPAYKNSGVDIGAPRTPKAAPDVIGWIRPVTAVTFTGKGVTGPRQPARPSGERNSPVSSSSDRYSKKRQPWYIADFGISTQAAQEIGLVRTRAVDAASDWPTGRNYRHLSGIAVSPLLWHPP
jgi:hypothetical protein